MTLDDFTTGAREAASNAAASARDRASSAREAAATARDTARDRASSAREVAVSARDSARDAAVSARDTATDRARDAATAAIASAAAVKPRLRGVVHQWAFFVSLALGAALVVLAGGERARVAVLVYVVSLSGLLGTSALYHRVNWSVRGRRRMRRLDHSMIFVLIAGTVTPIALLAMHGTLATVLLVIVWSGVVLGVLMKIVWIDAPKSLMAAIYVAVGCSGTIAIGALLGSVGVLAVAGLALGGLLYVAGAIIYATKRPDPVPTVFGYHEVFHVLVVAAAAIHFVVIAAIVVPHAG